MVVSQPLREESMKILFVADSFPYPPLDGVKVVAYYLLKELSMRNSLYLLSFVSEADEPHVEELRSTLNCQSIRTISWRRRRSMLGYLLNILRRYPYGLRQLYCSKMAQVIQEALKEVRADVVHYMGIGVAQYWKAAEGVPRVLAPLDCASFAQYQLYKTENNVTRKMHYFQNWMKMRHYERELYPKFHQCIFVTRHEERQIRQLSARVTPFVIPNGILVEDEEVPNFGKKEPYSLMFSGAMSHPANVDAVVYICEAILPRLRRRFPRATLYVVGRDPADKVLKLAKEIPGLVVTGFVADIRAYMRKSWVYVAAMRIGTGIKNKVLEALAVGMPVVGSPLAFSGIDITHGEDALIAEKAEDFITYISELFIDQDLRDSLSKKGRDFVITNHSWKKVASKYEDAYEAAIENFKTENLKKSNVSTGN
jgi:sugar transferase (PEP-CTERM/EpsH1 system associated)